MSFQCMILMVLSPRHKGARCVSVVCACAVAVVGPKSKQAQVGMIVIASELAEAEVKRSASTL